LSLGWADYAGIAQVTAEAVTARLGGFGLGIGYSGPTGLAVRVADGVVRDGDPGVAELLLVGIGRSRSAGPP